MTQPDYTPIYNGDRYCLMCRHVCPVERITRREATSPHGWALLIASVQRGLLTWDADAVDTLYQCADCGLCQANCATDRPLPAAIVAARAAVVEQGALPASVRDLDARLRRWGNPFGEISAPQDDEVPAAHDRPVVGLHAGMELFLDGGAAMRAAMRLLRAAGVEPRLISRGRASVYLPYTVGLWLTARDLARQTLAEIADAGLTQVLTLSRVDAHALQHVYPEIGVTVPEPVAVDEFVVWLAGAIADGRLRLRPANLPPVVYHDPCHTPRQLEHAGAARAVIAALTGSAPGELFWREKQAAPCGAIGGFLFTQPALATALARSRIAEARTAHAGLLVTEDPLCAAQLARHAEGLPVRNLLELVADHVVSEEV